MSMLFLLIGWLFLAEQLRYYDNNHLVLDLGNGVINVHDYNNVSVSQQS